LVKALLLFIKNRQVIKFYYKFNFSIRPHKHGRKGKSKHGILAVFGEFKKGWKNLAS